MEATVTKELEICISVDEHNVSVLSPKVTQESIIKTVQNIKQKLLDNNVEKEKVFDVYDISIELLQNILKYSYGNKIDENKKREADGKFVLKYNTKSDEIIICCCNLVTLSQVETIKQREKEVEGLDKKALRKLIRAKMKSKKDGHDHGAGLGFATVASKVSEMAIEFDKVLDNVMRYKIEIVI